MTKLKYPKYKYSGIEWLGDIPEHWEVSKLKFLTNRIVDGTHFTPTYVEEGVPFLRITDLRNKEIDFDSVKFIPLEEHNELIKRCNPEKGDVLLSKNGTVGITKIVDWDWDFSIFVSICLIKVKPILNPYFFTLLFGSKAVEVQITESGQKTSITNLHLTKIRELHCIIPPLSEQTKIANYLDQKIEKINTFITKKKQLIQLLKEQKAAVINEAVTKGLDKTVKMKDSGVEWLGEIPVHWEVRKLKYLSQVVRGGSPRPAGDSRFFGGSIPWITVGEITKDKIPYLKKTRTFLTEEGRKQSRFLEKGTLVMTNSGATFGVPKILDIGGCANDGVAAFLNVNEEKSIKLFLYYLLSSFTSKIRKEMNQGSTQPNLNTSLLGNLTTSLPPKPEQIVIVQHIETQTKKIDATIGNIERELELVEEYKVALISEAVTGKIFIN